MLLLSLFALMSCSFTRTKNVNITFKKETAESLQAYLNEKNVSYDNTDIAVLNSIDAMLYYNSNGRISVPEAYFFNRDGFRVKDSFKGTRCGQVINNTNQINAAPSDNKEHIGEWLKDFSFPLQESSPESYEGMYDAYIIISWAKFVDQISSSSNESAINWYNSLKNNKEMKIKTIFLNLDVQESWVLTEEQERAFGLHREGQ